MTDVSKLNFDMGAIRAELDKRSSKSGGKSGGAVFPFWNLKIGEQAKIRFLPDNDPENTLPWRDKWVCKLTFSHIEGQEKGDREVEVQVPTMRFWDSKAKCPVCDVASHFFEKAKEFPKGSDEQIEYEKLGRKYWMKKSGIFQGFVRSSPIEESPDVAGKIRRFQINKSILDNIVETIADLPDAPHHFEKGRDFIIRVAESGGFRSYKSSIWDLSGPSPLTEAELAVVNSEDSGLVALKQFQPKKPTQEELEVIAEMMNVSVEGGAYDPAKWGKYYKPYGLDIGDAGSTEVKTEVKAAVNVTTSDSSAVETKTESTEKVEEAKVEKSPPVETTAPATTETEDNSIPEVPTKEGKKVADEGISSIISKVRNREPADANANAGEAKAA